VLLARYKAKKTPRFGWPQSNRVGQHLTCSVEMAVSAKRWTPQRQSASASVNGVSSVRTAFKYFMNSLPRSWTGEKNREVAEYPSGV
jgi:hypothetical protein